MREILFRGKRKDNGKWICGRGVQRYTLFSLADGKHTPYEEFTIVPIGTEVYAMRDEDPETGEVALYLSHPSIPVDERTVSQYTGMKDKNGAMIFEGDLVISTSERRLTNKPQIVEYEPTSGYWMCAPKREPLVIGNIHDNSLEDFNGH